MTNAPATDKEARAADLHTRAVNCIRICQMELCKAVPDFEYAYDFADKALECIGTLRIMAIGGRA